MRRNELNNLQARNALGSIRPQDILMEETSSNSTLGKVRLHELSADEAALEFTGIYFKCANHHIFVNSTLESFGVRRNNTCDYIPQNASIHIFIGSGIDIYGICNLVETLAPKQAPITIHMRTDCKMPLIPRDIFPAMRIHIVKSMKPELFWCSDLFRFEWQQNVARITKSGNPTKVVTINSNHNRTDAIQVVPSILVPEIQTPEPYLVLASKYDFHAQHAVLQNTRFNMETMEVESPQNQIRKSD